MGAEQKVSHRLMARFALRKLHAALNEDSRIEDVRPLDARELKTGGTIRVGSYRQALHAFVDLDEGKLVVGCLLPLGGGKSSAKSLERRIRQLPRRSLSDGSIIRMTIGDKSLDTWVASTLEHWSSSTAASTAIGEVIVASGEALAALSTIRRVRRATPALHSEHQLTLPFGEDDAEHQLNLPILTRLDD